VRAVRTRVNSFVSFASRRVLHAAELFIIVAGQCETLSPSRDQPAEDLSLEDDGVTSIHDGTHFSPRFYSLAHNIQNLSPRPRKGSQTHSLREPFLVMDSHFMCGQKLLWTLLPLWKNYWREERNNENRGRRNASRNCEILSESNWRNSPNSDLIPDQLPRVSHRRAVGPGDVFGEIAFFTEVSQHEGVRSTSVCRVLTIPRADYHAVAATFPIGSRSVLDNILVRAQQACSALISVSAR